MKREGLKLEGHKGWDSTDIVLAYERKTKGVASPVKFTLHKHPKEDVICIDTGMGGDDLVCFDADALWDFCGRYFKYRKSRRKR